MKLNVDATVHLHSDHGLAKVLSTLQEVLSEIIRMSQQLEDLEATLARNTDATQSVVVLITTLRQEIIDAGTDPVALKAITDKLEENTQALAAAAVANTNPSARR